MKRTLLLISILFFTAQVQAAKLDTIDTYSDAMKKTIPALIITPDNYASGKEYPVIYLLHGAGGTYNQFLTMNRNIPDLADVYNLIIVCADGGNTSWYYDSPVDPAWKYETYITKELVPLIDKNYKTIKGRTGRAISGLSMGGHGAMYLAFRHQDIFGAVGSMSGGVDIRPFPKNWDMAKRLGAYAEFPENWEKNTVTNMLHLLTANSLSIIFDCGTEDFFYKVNRELHEKMVERNIPHDYTERPGNHSGPYWANAINYQVLYFNLYFKKNTVALK